MLHFQSTCFSWRDIVVTLENQFEKEYKVFIILRTPLFNSGLDRVESAGGNFNTVP